MFFDLNIPFLESDKNVESTNKTLISLRLSSVARSMELGYSGIAYDLPFRGVMSDSDRCKIPKFSLPSLLALSPSLPSSAAFRHDLLAAPPSSPFRQYTRITVAVDRLTAASAFAAKAVLRSYDLVAARPADQAGFDRACQVAEMDIIALELPFKFQLKLPMVTAALKRGVHFEIPYSYLISDVNVNTRRRIISDARLLVDSTRGKNLILSSSASSLNEIRGPYDIVNLASFLLGLSMERAKAAISSNCRSLICNALRKKDYKEAIRIERILPEKQLDSKGIWFNDWSDWDPLSSGKEDLPPLDDMSKHFSASNKLPKKSPAIDFLSCGNNFSLKDHISDFREDTQPMSKSISLLSCTKEPGCAAAMEVPSGNISEAVQKDEFSEVQVGGVLSVDMISAGLQKSGPQTDPISPRDMPMSSADSEGVCLDVSVNENIQTPTRSTMLSNASEVFSSGITWKHGNFEHEGQPVSSTGSSPKHDAMVIDFERPTTSMEDLKNSDCPDIISAADETTKIVTESVDCIYNVAGGHTSNDTCTFSSIPLEENAPELQNSSIVVEGEQKDEEDAPELHNSFIVVEGEQKDEVISTGIPMQMDFVRPTPSEEREDSSPVPDVAPLHNDEMKEREQRVGLGSSAGDTTVPFVRKTGKGRRKGRSLTPSYPLPLKSLLKPMLFKKRVCQSRKSCLSRRPCKQL